MPKRPDVAGILLFLAFGALGVYVLAILFPLIGFLWDTRPLVLIGVSAVLAVGLLMRLGRSGAARPVVAERLPDPHPGIRLHAIPISGGVGAVFALGFLAMFWFGLPGLRPVVLAVLGVGVLWGAVLTWLRSR